MGIILKIILVLVGIVAVIGVGGTIFLRSTLMRNGKERKPVETVYNGEGRGNALILYQPSPHGTADAMAKAAAEALQGKGFTVVTNYPGSSLTYDMDDYEVIGFGSAVYIGTVSEVLLRYLQEHPFKGKQVFLFSVGSNLKERDELTQMERAVAPGNMISKVKVKKGEEELIVDIIRAQFYTGQ